ncbi:capsule-associated protein CAP1 [Xylographa trunciseda]|nr:capsule-associated protein CAP1 [Xylographa trunciseda]
MKSTSFRVPQLIWALLHRIPEVGGHWAKVSRKRKTFYTLVGLALVCSILLLDSFYAPRVRTYFATLGSRPSIEHPVHQLVASADNEFDAVLKRQSKGLVEAVIEYKRRYKTCPPPHFDEWYAFAIEREVQLIDEFDGIYHFLLPFWGLEPSVIRERTREALGREDNFFLGISIRDSQLRTTGKGQGWHQVNETVLLGFQVDGILGMIENFAKWLPDMDLAFNAHDEPRVIVPHEDLEVLLETARRHTHSIKPIRNKFSTSPVDMGSGESYPEVIHTRFANLGHQLSWSHTRLSCPPSSPAGNPAGSSSDDVKSYSTHSLGFITNTTAFSDICLSPSLNSTFDRLNSYHVSLDLVPVFSPSKLSSFQDILYPSAWYYEEKVHYGAETSVPWDQKDPRLYWRGSTSSGFAQDGSWPNMLRQSVAMRLNSTYSTDPVHVLENTGSSSNPSRANWSSQEVPCTDFTNVFDVQFSEIKNCAEADCKAQLDFFKVTERAPQEEAWKARYLLDMDGNAFSGRFYAFMRSHSLPLKLTYFREWHWERLRPWVHFVPISRGVHEVPELVRYFEEEEEGQETASRLAQSGHQWAGKVLRKEDMEVWMFRLLLE